MIFQERCLKMVNNPLVFYFEKLKGIRRKKTFFDTFRWISQAVKPVFSVAKESPFLPLGKYTADMLLYRSRQYLYA